MQINNLKTGDILLFSVGWSWNPIDIFGKLIELVTHKPYSHVGMILKDPTWINPDMKGLYLWESSYEGVPDPEDGKIKLGVEITPLDVVLSKRNEKIYVRQLFTDENKLTDDVLINIHKISKDKPYDMNPFDWLSAYFRKPINGDRNTNRFFCSAFVSFIYTQAGIISEDTDWSIVRPSDFDEGDTHLIWENGCRLEGLFQIQ